MTIEWTRTSTVPPPVDGTHFWAFLYLSGIHKMRWMSPEERAGLNGWITDETDGAYVELGDKDREWEPEFWAPIDAIATPDEV